MDALHNEQPKHACKILTSASMVQGMKEQDFMSLMAVDKKALDGQLRFILLKGDLGQCIVTGDFDQALLSEVIRDYCN